VEILYLPVGSSKQNGLFKKIPDSSIIEGLCNQDSKTLNWLYDNYLQSVKDYVIRNSGSVEDVSDVFQDAIIILYKQITEDKITLTTDLKGYFFGIVKNVWNAQLRKKKRIAELEFDLPDEDKDENVNINDPDLERVVSRAFGKLKQDQQIVLNLFSEGHSYAEIAIEMNLKNDVYARRKKYLAKEALLEIIKEDPEYQEYLRFLK
jgi:RNA polymerase sigma factor (sigma-70 family)